MPITYISPKDFIEETKRWGVGWIKLVNEIETVEEPEEPQEINNPAKGTKYICDSQKCVLFK